MKNEFRVFLGLKLQTPSVSQVLFTCVSVSEAHCQTSFATYQTRDTNKEETLVTTKVQPRKIKVTRKKLYQKPPTMKSRTQ